jgi:hypothetical protein
MLTFGGLLTFLGVVFLLLLMAVFFVWAPFLLTLVIVLVAPLVILILLFGGGWGTAFQAGIGGIFGVFIWLCISEGELPFRIRK